MVSHYQEQILEAKEEFHVTISISAKGFWEGSFPLENKPQLNRESMGSAIDKGVYLNNSFYMVISYFLLRENLS